MARKTAVAMEKEWRAEADLHTLMEAVKIRKDRARLAAAKRYAREKQAALKSITEAKA